MNKRHKWNCRSSKYFGKHCALLKPNSNRRRSSRLERETNKMLHRPTQRTLFGVLYAFNVIRMTRSTAIAAAEPAKEVPLDLSGSISFQNKTNVSVDMTKDILAVENDHVQFYSKDVENCTVNMYVERLTPFAVINAT